jgi:PAS domain-containing protein
MFELLDDYYPSPKTALVVCDQSQTILAVGHASSAVTGYQERDLIGHALAERLQLEFGDDDPAGRSLEWGVRVMGVDCTFRPKGADTDRRATIDFFPAYDDDGGLLVALTPK